MDITFSNSVSKYSEIVVLLYFPASKEIVNIGITGKGIDQLLNNSTSKYIVGVWRPKTLSK